MHYLQTPDVHSSIPLLSMQWLIAHVARPPDMRPTHRSPACRSTTTYMYRPMELSQLSELSYCHWIWKSDILVNKRFCQRAEDIRLTARCFPVIANHSSTSGWGSLSMTTWSKMYWTVKSITRRSTNSGTSCPQNGSTVFPCETVFTSYTWHGQYHIA